MTAYLTLPRVIHAEFVPSATGAPDTSEMVWSALFSAHSLDWQLKRVPLLSRAIGACGIP